eukprot:scaffold687_cov44-Attheya_sp.AAC.4
MLYSSTRSRLIYPCVQELFRIAICVLLVRWAAISWRGETIELVEGKIERELSTPAINLSSGTTDSLLCSLPFPLLGVEVGSAAAMLTSRLYNAAAMTSSRSYQRRGLIVATALASSSVQPVLAFPQHPTPTISRTGLTHGPHNWSSTSRSLFVSSFFSEHDKGIVSESTKRAFATASSTKRKSIRKKKAFRATSQKSEDDATSNKTVYRTKAEDEAKSNKKFYRTKADLKKKKPKKEFRADR